MPAAPSFFSKTPTTQMSCAVRPGLVRPQSADTSQQQKNPARRKARRIF
jgi:hypothetical protein